MKASKRLAAGLAAAILLLAGMLLAGPLLNIFSDSSPAAGRAAFRSSIQLDPGQYASEAEENDLIQHLAVIDADQARAIALAENDGNVLLSVELANINGSVVYEVDLEDGRELFIDAGTGEILAIE